MDPIKSVSGIHFPTEIDFKSFMLCKRASCPKRKAKYETRYRRYREIEIFSATPKMNKYGDKVVTGFRGESQENLLQNIDTYLSDLMDFINEPVADCPHCKGRGVILPKNVTPTT